MTPEESPMTARKALEMYFLDNRARLLEIASFLDRIDRYRDSADARNDFRYQSFLEALKQLSSDNRDRTKRVQLIFSDLSVEPIEQVQDPKAYGAWKGALREGN